MDPKDINQTNFCNKKVDNVVSNDIKKYIIDDMKLRTGITPTSRYAKIFNPNYSKNFKNPHIFCLKSYGAPYLLYLTKINSINYVLLIDKKINNGHEYPKMFVVQYRFNDDLFNGTLFECELLRDNSNMWQLLLADIYYYKGKMMKDVTITDRINHINSILEEEYIDNTFCDTCPLFIKRYFDIVDKESVISEFIPELNYKIRGIYFVPININYSNILYMFKENELKINIKTVNKKHVLNFKITTTMKPEVYELHLNDHDTLTKVGYAYIKDIESSRYVKDLLDQEGDIIVECEYNERFKKWQPIKQTTQRIHHMNDLELVNT